MKRSWLVASLLLSAGCSDCGGPPSQTEGQPLPAHTVSAAELDDASVARLEELCEEVPDVACRPYGERLRNAAGDPEAARVAFQRGCEGEDGPACVALGRMWRSGQGGERSNEEALSWYRAGCEFGAAMGCNNAAILLRDGQGVDADPDLAMPLFQQACDAEYWVGCEAFGRMVMEAGLAHPSAAVARSGLERACVDGAEPLACIALAEWARDLEDDEAAARTLYSRACNLDDVPGCVEFARLAHAGAGGPADPALGRQLLDLGCRRGVLAACVDIARIYETGDGVEPDSARAEAFLRHACEAGWSEACPPEADGPAGPPQ